MTSGQANTAILISGFGSIAVVSITNLANGKPPAPRVLIGGAFAFALLGFAATVAPGPAGLLALLIFAGVLLTDAGKFFKLFGG